MKNLMIDTLGYAEALEQSGFSREQARGAARALNNRALINTVGEELATKADLAQSNSKLRAEMNELQAKIAEKRPELHTETSKARTNTKMSESRAALKREFMIARWMLVIVIIAVMIRLVL